MPKTRAWSNSIPLGSRVAKEIDDAIRELRVDIDERMLDVSNWHDDPVTLLAASGGAGGVNYSYADANPNGSKINFAINIAKWVSFNYLGVTNTVGVIVLRFSETPSSWLVSDIIGGSTLLTGMPYWIQALRTSDGLKIFGNIALFDTAANELWIKLSHADGADVASTSVMVNILLAMRVSK